MLVLLCIARSCLILFCDPMDYSPPGSPVHGILQARILQWVAIYFSRVSFRPRYRTCVSCLGRWILYRWATKEALILACLFTLIVAMFEELILLIWLWSLFYGSCVQALLVSLQRNPFLSRNHKDILSYFLLKILGFVSTLKFIFLLELVFVCNVRCGWRFFFPHGSSVVPSPVTEGRLLSLLVSSIPLSSSAFYGCASLSLGFLPHSTSLCLSMASNMLSYSW